jgi:hypothetical protein
LSLFLVIARKFKPVRFFVMMAVAAFIVWGELRSIPIARLMVERVAYATGWKAGEQAPADAILPTAAELNMIAQEYFKQQGSGDQLRSSSRAAELQAWDLAFENGYTGGFNKTHGR